uniref:Uncharacterized protein n=1 Tax=Arundo donax TaxID=35708 RepID=A0A0A8YYM2_ARUDO
MELVDYYDIARQSHCSLAGFRVECARCAVQCTQYSLDSGTASIQQEGDTDGVKKRETKRGADKDVLPYQNWVLEGSWASKRHDNALSLSATCNSLMCH